MDWILAFLVAYLIGSIPFGLLLAMAAGKGDIRQIGSGNIGATNVLRTGSKWLAAATLLLDLGKGLAAVVLAEQLWPATGGGAALGAVLGHCFPLWLRFKGGKGVATAAGICFGLGWLIGAIYAGVWLGLLAITRISSLSGMSAAIAAPVAVFALGGYIHLPLVVVAVIIIIQHRANIVRLRAGIEPKVGSKA